MPEPASSEDTAGARDAAPRQLVVAGFVDTVLVYNFNRPADRANFFPGVGTSAKRDAEFGINLAQLDLTLAPRPLGAKLSLGFGNATEVVHAAELRGAATSPDAWRHVVQASLQWQTAIGRGLLIEAGVFPSHIGMESFATRDNWNYTRSWLGELSPYYQTGVKVTWPLSARWSAQVQVLNGWQSIADNNRAKSLGTRIAYASDRLAVALNTLVGPEQADNERDLRLLGDLVATLAVTPSLGLGLSVDAAREARTPDRATHWHGFGLYARFARPASSTALALRAERYDDPDGAISGVPQRLHEITLTLERRPVAALLLRLEGRYDRSSAAVFASDTLDGAGLPLRKRNQFLLLFGALASF